MFLARARDSDATVRKQVYVRLENKASEQLSPLSPSSLSVETRTSIILRGLKDRESSVSDAARKLLKAWFKVLTSVKDNNSVKDEDGQSGAKMLHDLACVFEMFGRDGEGALVALNTLFKDDEYHPAVDSKVNMCINLHLTDFCRCLEQLNACNGFHR